MLVVLVAGWFDDAVDPSKPTVEAELAALTDFASVLTVVVVALDTTEVDLLFVLAALLPIELDTCWPIL